MQETKPMTYRQSMELEPVDGPSIETIMDGKVAMHLTESLNDRFRLVVDMVIIQEISVAEVALELGISRRRVSKYLKQALETLNVAMTQPSKRVHSHRFKCFPKR